ncbi:MAG: TlpA disulfide reductase family protein [Saprospiraceae bacterium]
MKKVLLGLAMIVIGFLIYKLFIGGVGLEVGKTAPDFEANLQDGTPIKLSGYQGDYVLLDFWGSWCAPCRRENPSLVKIYQKFENKKTAKGEGFEIVSIALEKIKKQAEGAIKRDNLYWPNHIISMRKIVLLSPLAQKYNVSSIPAKFLINPEGKIISINPTIVEIEKTLDKYLQ